MVRLARSLPDLAIMIQTRCDQITGSIRRQLEEEAQDIRRDFIMAVKDDDLDLLPLAEKTLEDRAAMGIDSTAPLYATGDMMHSFMVYRFGNKYGSYYRVAASHAMHLGAKSRYTNVITNAHLFHIHSDDRPAMEIFLEKRIMSHRLRKIVERAEDYEYPSVPMDSYGTVISDQGSQWDENTRY